MSNAFSDKYTSGMHRPSCYSDPEYYDSDDPDCIRCPVFTACGVMTRRKEQNRTNPGTTTTSQTVTSGTTATSQRPTSVDRHRKTEPSPIVQPAESDTYWSVLSHNASLEAVQAMVDELAFSIRQAPRKSYHGMFVKREKA